MSLKEKVKVWKAERAQRLQFIKWRISAWGRSIIRRARYWLLRLIDERLIPWLERRWENLIDKIFEGD